MAEEQTPRPDYLVEIGDAKVLFEVKEISEDENFTMEPLKAVDVVVSRPSSKVRATCSPKPAGSQRSRLSSMRRHFIPESNHIGKQVSRVSSA